MSHSSPPGVKYNRSSLLSLENNYRHANDGAKTLTIKKLKSVYEIKYFLEYQFAQNLSLLRQEHYHIDQHFSYPIHMTEKGFQIDYYNR